MKDLNINDQDISDAQMRSISAKTMVIVGDADGVKLEHARLVRHSGTKMQCNWAQANVKAQVGW